MYAVLHPLPSMSVEVATSSAKEPSGKLPISDTAVKLKFCLWGDAVRQMSFAQRFSGFLYATLSAA
jgi:hypothetical protein